MDWNELRRPRRIVTGLGGDGRSCLARVEEVEQIDYPYVMPDTQTPPPDTAAAETMSTVPGGGYFQMWATDRLPIPLPNDGKAPFLDSEPTAAETPLALRRAHALPPPLGARIAIAGGPHLGSPPPGEWHWHDTVELFFQLSGQREIIHDDGLEFAVRPGDVVIQHATHHAHFRRTDPRRGNDASYIGAVCLGGLRVGAPPPLASLHAVQRGSVGGHRLGELRGKPLFHNPSWSGEVPTPGPPPADLDGRMLITEIEQPRRIVTGQDDDGVAHVARVDEVQSINGGIYPIWAADRLPILLPTDGLAAPLDTHPTPEQTPAALCEALSAVPPAGMRASVVKLLPTKQPPSLSSRDSMDVIFIMSGEPMMIMDDGSKIDLGIGDCVIQNGTRQALHNPGDSAVWLGVVSLGAVRFGDKLS